jgi:hypothetical protein
MNKPQLTQAEKELVIEKMEEMFLFVGCEKLSHQAYISKARMYDTTQEDESAYYLGEVDIYYPSIRKEETLLIVCDFEEDWKEDAYILPLEDVSELPEDSNLEDDSLERDFMYMSYILD